MLTTPWLIMKQLHRRSGNRQRRNNPFCCRDGNDRDPHGMLRRFKELNPDIKIIGVEPYKAHKIQGLKNMEEAIVPELYDPSLLDEKINVSDEDAFKTAKLLAREEGIFSGMSAGAAFYASLLVAKELDKGLIVTIIPDSGEKYMSTPLYCLNPCKHRSENCILKDFIEI